MKLCAGYAGRIKAGSLQCRLKAQLVVWSSSCLLYPHAAFQTRYSDTEL